MTTQNQSRGWRRLAILGVLTLIVFSIAVRGGHIELPSFSRVQIPSPPTDGLEVPQTRRLVALREAVEADPDSLEAWMEYGYMLDALGMNDDAILVYEQAAKMAPEDPRPRYGLAHLFRIVGRIDESIALFGQLAEEMPDYPPVFVRYGDALDYAGRPAEAVVAYRKAVALDPNFPQARRQLGQTLLTLGEIDEAIEELETARSMQDRDRATYLALSRAYELAGNPDLADELGAEAGDMKAIMASRDSFRLPVTRLRPVYTLSRIEAQAALRAKRYEAALDPLLNVVSVWPEERWVHLGLVLAFEANGDLVSADRHRRIAEQLDQLRSGTPLPRDGAASP